MRANLPRIILLIVCSSCLDFLTVTFFWDDGKFGQRGGDGLGRYAAHARIDYFTGFWNAGLRADALRGWFALCGGALGPFNGRIMHISERMRRERPENNYISLLVQGVRMGVGIHSPAPMLRVARANCSIQ